MIQCQLDLWPNIDQDTRTVYCNVHGALGSIPRVSRTTNAKLNAKAEELFQAHLREQAGQEFPGVTDPVVRDCLTLEREIADLRADADSKYKVLLDKLCDDLTAEQRIEYRRVLYGGES